MAHIEKAELKELLEEAFMDVAEALAGDYSRIQRGMSTQHKLGRIWTMAELGDLPEYEPSFRVVKTG